MKRYAQKQSLGRSAKPYLYSKIDSADVIKTLSTEGIKHVIWAGHGTLRNMEGKEEAMGLLLDDVSTIINQCGSVKFWDLHTCSLLGNIRKIMDHLHHAPLIKVNNGFVTESSPPSGCDDLTSIYLFLASRVINKGKPEKIARLFL